MGDTNRKIEQLHEKLEYLSRRQEGITREISELRTEISRLKANSAQPIAENTEASFVAEQQSAPASSKPTQLYSSQREQQQATVQPVNPRPSAAPLFPKKKSNLEKFIGENLISKIGIAITVIGVAIGAKYAIDHELISPLTRIILGYLFGFGLLGIAAKLKNKYESYSAVLLSGAMAILYFITYLAYSLYSLIPAIPSFAVMVLITVFTVAAALRYNRQVIAHIGLVGAYAVPFLLSDGSGRVEILFSYVAIINIGILAISFKKYWKPLSYSSFALTWLIYGTWYLFSYNSAEDFGTALSFLIIFFAIFYFTFLAYKLHQKEKFVSADLILLLTNTFLFYATGYSVLSSIETGANLLGLFTLCNALVHLAVCITIYRQKLADRNLFYLIAGLVLVFVTIAIPVQLNGGWVTLLWTGEAAVLFWIGRTRKVATYELLAYPLMVLAFFSIVQDWSMNYYHVNAFLPETNVSQQIPILNVNFLLSVLFIAAFGFINYISYKHESPLLSPAYSNVSGIAALILPLILLIAIYFAFSVEISGYFNQLHANSAIVLGKISKNSNGIVWNEDLLRFKAVWLICYTLLFASLLSYVNIRRFKNQLLGKASILMIAITAAAYLVQGLYELSELRESYIHQTQAQYYHIGIWNIGIRYISFAFVAAALRACFMGINQIDNNRILHRWFEIGLHVTLLWIISSELINWLDIAGSSDSDKLGLSILWGFYSLMLIAVGILWKRKHLRIAAIVLFGITLIKLFFYDMSHLNTISKTVVLVALGVLLLIISFLYNKYRYIITEDSDISDQEE